MIDRIIEVDGDESAIGIKNVSVNEPIFQGHFPAIRFSPACSSSRAWRRRRRHRHRRRPDQGQHIVYMVTVDKCKFRKPARPGDTIEYHIRKIRRRSAMGWYEARRWSARR